MTCRSAFPASVAWTAAKDAALCRRMSGIELWKLAVRVTKPMDVTAALQELPGCTRAKTCPGRVEVHIHLDVLDLLGSNRSPSM